MELNFTLDLDSKEIHIIVDNAAYVVVYKDEEGWYYKNFESIEDEILKEKLKEVCEILFTLEDAE